MLLLVAATAAWKRLATTHQKDDPLEIVLGPLCSPYRVLPLSYLVDDLFCRRSSTALLPRTFGESISGDESFPSLFDVRVGKAETCSTTCTKNFIEEQKTRLIFLIDSDYRYSMSIDGLPLTGTSLGTDDPRMIKSFEVGYVRGGLHYLYNFFKFNISVTGV